MDYLKNFEKMSLIELHQKAQEIIGNWQSSAERLRLAANRLSGILEEVRTVLAEPIDDSDKVQRINNILNGRNRRG